LNETDVSKLVEIIQVKKKRIDGKRWQGDHHHDRDRQVSLPAALPGRDLLTLQDAPDRGLQVQVDLHLGVLLPGSE